MINQKCYDHLFIRCPSLGGEVPFSYCRKQGPGVPCLKLPRCWINQVDIVTYIKAVFSPEEIKSFFLQPSSPSGRMAMFLENLERVKNMQQDQEQREIFISNIKEAAPDGKISCTEAARLADEHQVSREEMGKLLNELKIKIKNCQFGCF